MVFEVIDNAIDEALAGHCKNITVTMNKDNTITVEDDGRGIPVDTHKSEKISAAEVIMTTSCWWKIWPWFVQSIRRSSWRRCFCCKCLIGKTRLNIYRDGKEYLVVFKNGNTLKPLKQIGKTKKRGTRINFLPSKEIFSSTKFSASTIEKRIRELAFLNKGICVKLLDQTSKKEKEFVHKYDGGIVEFVKHINNKKPILVNKNEKIL